MTDTRTGVSPTARRSHFSPLRRSRDFRVSFGFRRTWSSKRCADNGPAKPRTADLRRVSRGQKSQKKTLAPLTTRAYYGSTVPHFTPLHPTPGLRVSAFRGQFEHQMDDKGRLALPSAFRRGAVDAFVLVQLQRPYLTLFPEINPYVNEYLALPYQNIPN